MEGQKALEAAPQDSYPTAERKEEEITDPIVSPLTQVFLGIIMEQWLEIRENGISALPQGTGESRIKFPAHPYGEDMDVMIEINVPKCLAEGIDIREDSQGDFYTL